MFQFVNAAVQVAGFSVEPPVTKALQQGLGKGQEYSQVRKDEPALEESAGETVLGPAAARPPSPPPPGQVSGCARAACSPLC